jgi:NAD-dependent SIR2 family protein deacetylase
MAEPKVIYCPMCHRRVAQWDGKSTINIVIHCKSCKKRIIYDVITEEIEMKSIPLRHSSSGMRFY